MLYSILFMYRCTSLDTASKNKIMGAVSNYYIAYLYLNAKLVFKC